MGAITPGGDALGLATVLAAVLRDRYVKPRAEIAGRFDLNATAGFHEQLYRAVQTEVAAGRPAPALARA